MEDVEEVTASEESFVLELNEGLVHGLLFVGDDDIRAGAHHGEEGPEDVGISEDSLTIGDDKCKYNDLLVKVGASENSHHVLSIVPAALFNYTEG